MRNALLLSLFFVLSGSPLFGQVIHPGDPLLEYYDLLELKNPDMESRLYTHPSILYKFNNSEIVWNPWNIEFSNTDGDYFEILPARFDAFFNSEYPRSINDGAVWKGKGLTSAIYGGVSGKKGILEYTLSPVVYFSQNLDHELAAQRDNASIYNYQFSRNRIDYIQQFGDGSFVQADWGQTEIRLVYEGFTVGASTQNIVWGPAIHNPILRSNNAAGFPHIELGTHVPFETVIGNWEISMIWGSLQESDYYDSNDDNNYRYLAGGNLALEFGFIKGLKMGFSRILYKRGEDFNTRDLVVHFFNYNDRVQSPDGDTPNSDGFDQMASISMEWVFPEQGFNAYMEFGKNDFGGTLFSQEPEHARGYVLGFTKLVELSTNQIFRLGYERAVLDKAKAGAFYRVHQSWYEHHVVRHGYTHLGQIVGSGIGPGSTSDVFDIDFFFPMGKFGFNAQRIRFNDDYYFRTFSDQRHHDHEWHYNFEYLRVIGDWQVMVNLGLSSRVNIHYIRGNDVVNINSGLHIKRNL